MGRLRTHNRRARLRAAMRPWLTRLEPGLRPDLAAAVKRVLRARAADGGPLRLAWLRGLAVPFVGPHDGQTTIMLEERRRGPLRARIYHVGPDGASWWLMPAKGSP